MLSTGATAQTPAGDAPASPPPACVPGSTTGNPLTKTYSHELQLGVIESSTTGMFSGDGRLDCLNLANGQLRLIVSPAFAYAEANLALPPAILFATAATGCRVSSVHRDDPVISHGIGMSRYILDPLDGTFSTVTVAGAGSWAGAVKLFTADIHSTPGDELVGVFPNYDGTSTLRVGSFDSAGNFTTIATTPTRFNPIAVEPVNWDASDNQDEIAVIFSFGATFVDMVIGKGGQDELIYTDWRGWPGTAKFAAPIVDADGVGCAVQIEAPGGDNVVRVMRKSYTESPISTGLIDIVDMKASTSVVTADSDLVFLTKTIAVLENTSGGAGASFSSVASTAYPTEHQLLQTTGLGLGALNVGDFDGDGDADVYTQETGVTDSFNHALVMMNNEVVEWDTQPLLDCGEVGTFKNVSALTGNPLAIDFPTDPGDDVYITQRILNLDSLTGYDWLEAQVWFNDHGVDVDLSYTPFVGSGFTWDSDEAIIRFPFASDGIGIDGYAVMFIRGVNLDPVTGEIIAASTSMRIGFSLVDLQIVLGTVGGIGTTGGDDDPPPPGGGGGSGCESKVPPRESECRGNGGGGGGGGGS